MDITCSAPYTVSLFNFHECRLRSDRVRIHEQLALSIIAVQILFLIGVGRTAADDSTPVVSVGLCIENYHAVFSSHTSSQY